MVTTSTSTSPSTLLEAVNKLLQAVRLGPIMSLAATDINVDASSALLAINDVCREVQLYGYEFNTDRGYPINPDILGNLNLPNNTLKATPSASESSRYVKRGLKLYDSDNHTFAINKTVYVDLTVALPFEELPESFKLYITALAARRWCLPKMPDNSTFQYTAEYVQRALSLAEQEDAETRDGDLSTTSPHFYNMRRR